MHGIGLGGQGCRHREGLDPFPRPITVSERLELPSGCDTLFVDVDHDARSQIFIQQDAEATLSDARPHRCQPSYPQIRFGVRVRGNRARTVAYISSAPRVRGFEAAAGCGSQPWPMERRREQGTLLGWSPYHVLRQTPILPVATLPSILQPPIRN